MLIQKSKRKTNLVVIEYVKGAIICLKVLEDANSCFAEPTLRLLRFTLEYQRESVGRRRNQLIFSKTILTEKILREVRKVEPTFMNSMHL